MDVHQRHLDAGLIIAIEGNRLLGEQLRGLDPAGAAAYAMALAEALGVSEAPSLMPGCLEIDPPVEIEDDDAGPTPCTNAFCSWPTNGCRINEEFAGVVDAEDFYDTGDTDTCASTLAEQVGD